MPTSDQVPEEMKAASSAVLGTAVRIRLIEELLGEIVDEYDREKPEVAELGDGRYRISARLSVEDLGDLFGLEIDDDA